MDKIISAFKKIKGNIEEFDKMYRDIIDKQSKYYKCLLVDVDIKSISEEKK